MPSTEVIEIARHEGNERSYGDIRGKFIASERRRIYRDLDGHVVGELPFVEGSVVLKFGKRVLFLNASEVSDLALLLNELWGDKSVQLAAQAEALGNGRRRHPPEGEAAVEEVEKRQEDEPIVADDGSVPARADQAPPDPELGIEPEDEARGEFITRHLLSERLGPCLDIPSVRQEVEWGLRCRYG